MPRSTIPAAAAIAASLAAHRGLDGRPSFSSLPPLSLYVHLPWCVHKCPYCDFNSYTARGRIPEEDYVAALLRDLDAEAHLAQGRPVESLFIGGGTPSLFSGNAIERLVAGIRARVAVSANAEVTLEANPGAVDAERFADFRNAGVNRLSIGVQSFRDSRLATLGRAHDCHGALQAFELAARAGFANVNLDLMYALPGDDAAGALQDLAIAVGLAPAHLSWYQLTLEPNTAFHRRPPALPADDAVAEMEDAGRALLSRHGYRRYEISAYAQPGRRCVHNLHYWSFGDYLGIGAGAHGKVTLSADGSIRRRAKTRNPLTYMDRAGAPQAVTEERIASSEQIALEFMMNALRLIDGVAVECFESRTGQPRAAIDEAVTEAIRRGWLCDEPGSLKPTKQGLEVLNSLLLLF
jgi:putative oxygen-independent coproporphyrinogen III oxidase